MSKEIERRFLLAEGTSIPIPALYRKHLIKQAYIVGQKDKQVRVRISDGKGVLCVKYTAKFIRDEFEYDIPLKDAKVMYDNAATKIEKKRLSFKSRGYSYDVDSFPNGLTFVEVEFKSIKNDIYHEKSTGLSPSHFNNCEDSPSNFK
jgi:CYTH domain-containing protein